MRQRLCQSYIALPTKVNGVRTSTYDAVEVSVEDPDVTINVYLPAITKRPVDSTKLNI